jgi:hypothetical protein
MESGLTLLSHAYVPIQFWTTTFCTVIFLINHLPTSVLGYNSPHEVIFGYASAYNSLRVLGVPATHYLHNLIDQNSTLNPYGVCFLVIQIITKDISVLNLRQVASTYLVMWNLMNLSFSTDACRNLTHMFLNYLKSEHFLDYSRPWLKKQLSQLKK